jgi:D-alanyl-D-alanine carboxypeptidase/D-alanyl-D-alanine-endopeptidase (penicillin-binding protein 4)
MTRTTLMTSLLVAMALVCGAIARADDVLPPPVQAALDRAGVPANAMAGIAIPLHWWGTRWEHGPDKPMQPASTMKVVTTVVALDRLGPNLRGRTELLTAAPLEGDVLRGDLVLRGGADPELGWPQLWQLFNELRERGVREIAGDIVLDRTLFRPARFDLGLPPFDDEPEFGYNVIPDALLFTGNLMAMELRSDATGVNARTLPHIDGVAFTTGAMGLVDALCNDWDDTWKPPAVHDDGKAVRIELKGSFPRNCNIRTELQLFDRTRLAELTLRTLWRQLGGTWQGRMREEPAPTDARVLVHRQSRPWGEVLRFMNKTSDNALTRLLYLQLGISGMKASPQATTSELAERSVRSWFDEHGISTTGLVLDNGSGLSRSERITPRQLALLIKAAHAGPLAPELLMSLPTVGVDGTMRNRMKNTPAAGWARLKSGTLRNVRAVAGVVRDDAGRPWVLAAMINHDKAGDARPALDELVNYIARGQPLPIGFRTERP